MVVDEHSLVLRMGVPRLIIFAVILVFILSHLGQSALELVFYIEVYSAGLGRLTCPVLIHPGFLGGSSWTPYWDRIGEMCIFFF